MSQAHSKFGGSVIDVIVNCNDYINANRDFPNETNEAAEKGTAYHECAEYCERLGIDAEDARDLTFNGRFKCDQDMIDSTQLYLNYIRSLRVKYPDMKVIIEGKFGINSIGDDVYGYADFLGYSLSARKLFVIDLKAGFGYVDVEGLQTKYYGIAAMDTLKLWFAIDEVETTIVQPRKEFAEGKIRTRNYSNEQMVGYKNIIANAIEKARKKGAERKAGTWCKHCKAAATCRKRAERTVFLAYLNGSLADLSNEEISAILKEADIIERNLKTIKEHANKLARGGSSFDGFKLVKPIVHANCTDEAEFKKELLAKVPDLDPANLYNPGRLKGKSILKKELKNPDACDVVDKYFKVEQKNAELVPLSNPRSAIGSNANGVFAPIEDSNYE